LIISQVYTRHHSTHQNQYANKKFWPFKSSNPGDFSSQTYNNLTAEQKMTSLWQKIIENYTPYGWYFALNLAVKIFWENMNPTFDHFSDVFPSGRDKVIHSVGTVTRAKFIAEPDTPYTGIFKGASHVLLRLSAASKPDSSKSSAEGALNNFKPGFGLKMLRKGVPSANLVGMFSLEGQSSWNFFKNDLNSHTTGGDKPNFVEKKLMNHFSTASKHIKQIGMLDMATFDENGTRVTKPVVPYKLILRPRLTVKAMFTDNFQADYTDQITRLAPNLLLYDVLALKSPKAKPQLIGKLHCVGNHVTSNFGDKFLFFRHSRMELDFNHNPLWQAEEILSDPKFRRRFVESYGFDHP